MKSVLCHAYNFIFCIICTVHSVIILSQTQELLTKHICNPYIRFGNQVAILRGRIKESQTSMASMIYTLGIIMEVHIPLTILKLIYAYSHKTKRYK